MAEIVLFWQQSLAKHVCASYHYGVVGELLEEVSRPQEGQHALSSLQTCVDIERPLSLDVFSRGGAL
ncbi:MAG: hypothetical protein ACUVQH_00195 [Thermogutta sp.]